MSPRPGVVPGYNHTGTPQTGRATMNQSLTDFFRENPELTVFAGWIQVSATEPNSAESWLLAFYEPIPRDPDTAHARNQELWREIGDVATQWGAARTMICLGRNLAETRPYDFDATANDQIFRYSLSPAVATDMVPPLCTHIPIPLSKHCG